MWHLPFFSVHVQYHFTICFQNKYVMVVGATLFLGSLGYIVYMNVTDTKPKQTYVTLDEDGGLSSRPRVSRWEWISDGCPVRQCLNVIAVCHQQCQLQEWLHDGHPVKQCLNVIAVTSSANSPFIFFTVVLVWRPLCVQRNIPQCRHARAGQDETKSSVETAVFSLK